MLAAVTVLTDGALVLDRGAADAVGLLALVAGQDVEWITDTGSGGTGEEGAGGS